MWHFDLKPRVVTFSNTFSLVSSRKPAAVPAPPPVDLEEDFMILDDEAPVLFVIPRKAEVSRSKKPVPVDNTKENVLTEPHSTDRLSQSETDATNQHGKDAKRNKIESGKQKLKGKHGKALKKNGEGTVTHDSVEDGAKLVTETLEDRVSDQTSSQTVQGQKAVPTGKSHFYLILELWCIKIRDAETALLYSYL